MERVDSRVALESGINSVGLFIEIDALLAFASSGKYKEAIGLVGSYMLVFIAFVDYFIELGEHLGYFVIVDCFSL